MTTDNQVRQDIVARIERFLPKRGAVVATSGERANWLAPGERGLAIVGTGFRVILSPAGARDDKKFGARVLFFAGGVLCHEEPADVGAAWFGDAASRVKTKRGS